MKQIRYFAKLHKNAWPRSWQKMSNIFNECLTLKMLTFTKECVLKIRQKCYVLQARWLLEIGVMCLICNW